jgi:hypothetical protein
MERKSWSTTKFLNAFYIIVALQFKVQAQEEWIIKLVALYVSVYLQRFSMPNLSRS